MKELLNNKLLWIPIITWFLVQLFKLIWEIITNRKGKINFKRILGAGGMPSSHTACISSLATSIGIVEGFGSTTFALAAIFTFIVMYDAAGVRRAAGKQARVLNKIIESEKGEVRVQERLVELLGHTPVEVFVGLLVGIGMGLLLCHIWDL